MVLGFDARPATRVVDALFQPDGPVLKSAEVAAGLHLPRSWLNDQTSSYVSGRAGCGTPVYDHPNLRVMTTPPDHLLAMKVRAARKVGGPPRRCRRRMRSPGGYRPARSRRAMRLRRRL